MSDVHILQMMANTHNRSPSKPHAVQSLRTSSHNAQGKLSKSLGHLAVSFTHPKKNVIKIELHHGSRKSVATLRTVRTLIVRRTIAPSWDTGMDTGIG